MLLKQQCEIGRERTVIVSSDANTEETVRIFRAHSNNRLSLLVIEHDRVTASYSARQAECLVVCLLRAGVGPKGASEPDKRLLGVSEWLCGRSSLHLDNQTEWITNDYQVVFVVELRSLENLAIDLRGCAN